MHDLAYSARAARAVDNTDWLKTAAIILVLVDHTGYFFIEDDQWWSVFGRLAAPVFFFLLGYAETRTVPPYWIWLGILLTALDSWNANWSWVPPNILLSFALIRLARPYLGRFAAHFGWIAIFLVGCTLLATLPVAANLVDYGAEGWLWALFGFAQRRRVDGASTEFAEGPSQGPAPTSGALADHAAIARLLTCLGAAVIYVWQEQLEFSFSQMQFAVFVLGVAALSSILCLFRRGPSAMQPPEPFGGALRFVGRHTLEIYAIQLAGFELITILFPQIAP